MPPPIKPAPTTAIRSTVRAIAFTFPLSRSYDSQNATGACRTPRAPGVYRPRPSPCVRGSGRGGQIGIRHLADRDLELRSPRPPRLLDGVVRGRQALIDDGIHRLPVEHVALHHLVEAEALLPGSDPECAAAPALIDHNDQRPALVVEREQQALHCPPLPEAALLSHCASPPGWGAL